MLINLRNALMTGKRLPYDAEVEYLESTGTQYVDTGITPDTLDLSVELTLLSKGGHVFGCRNSSNLVYGNIWSAYSNATSMREDWLLSSSIFAISSTVPNTVTFSSTTNGSSISYGGQTYTGNAKTTYSYSMVLFGVSTAGVVSTGKMVIYACKIWKNGVLVRDFIPVRKGAVGYLYDRVSGKLFGNAGTGDFVLGSDVVPVEYIESRSDHIQVIDTGFYANQNTKSLITFEKLGADGWLFGTRNGSPSATDKFGIFAYRSPDGKISAQVGNIYIEPIISGGLTYRKKTIELSLADGVTVDGETIATFSESQKSQTFTSTYPIALFNMRVSSSGFNSGIYCRVYAYQIFENGLITRNFLPVRVGTDATSWEGAMMDVLTRRIYRNAGTGAFGYGNDLKYPIASE